MVVDLDVSASDWGHKDFDWIFEGDAAKVSSSAHDSSSSYSLDGPDISLGPARAGDL